MAQTIFGVNDDLAVKLWSKKLSYEALQATKLSQFIGTTADSLIQVKDETNKNSGSKITFGLRMQLRAPGVSGESILDGNEEKLIFRNDSLYIDQLRNAVLNVGAVSQQRVPFDLREEGKAGLVDWWADRLDTCLMNQLAGNTNITDKKYTGMNDATLPLNTIYPGSKTTEAAVSTGQITDPQTTSTYCGFTLDLLSRARVAAETAKLPIRPITIGNQKVYVAFIHPLQALQLKKSVQTGQWLDIQKAAMTGGQVSDNPIFTGALGMYDGVVIHVDNRVPYGDSNNTKSRIDTRLNVQDVARAIFCGAQAAMLSFGRDSGWPFRMRWVEELKDYENQLGVSAGMIFGVKKTVFTDGTNKDDFGVITIPTKVEAV